MELLLEAYKPAVMAVGAVGLLLLVQLLVADVLGIAMKHVPGTPVAPDHGSILFRAHRAHVNTNESVAAFILGVLFCLALSAPAQWLNGLCWLYVFGRAGHMLCYYCNIKMLRSVFFGTSLLALFGMFALGFLSGYFREY